MRLLLLSLPTPQPQLLTLLHLRLLDDGEEGRATVPPTGSSDQLQLDDDAAAAKKKKKAAAKKKRYKRNKAATKHKKAKLLSSKHEKIKLLSWLGAGGSGMIPWIVMVGSITALIALSLIHNIDRSGEGEAPQALPPSASASRSLRQNDLRSNNVDSTSPDMISSPLAAVVSPPIFSPAAVGGRCSDLDIPNWKDSDGWDLYAYKLEPEPEDYSLYGYGGDQWVWNRETVYHSCSSSGGLRLSESKPTASSYTVHPTSSATSEAEGSPGLSATGISHYSGSDGSILSAKLDAFKPRDPAIFLACINGFCCIVVICLYLVDKCRSRGNTLTMPTERRLEEDHRHAMSRIGRNSVYSYFLTVSKIGWLAALSTFVTQFFILTFFLNSAKSRTASGYGADLDSAASGYEADLDKYGWAIFAVLLVAFLGKDVISGFMLIYHSSRARHHLDLKTRIRYYFGGMCLCSITGFTVYVSILYNAGISKSNTELIVNSVIIHFVLEMDQRVFSALAVINEKWTAHAADSEFGSETEAEMRGTIEDIKVEIALQKAQIASQEDEITSQREELEILRSQQEELMLEKEEVARQRDKITMLEEAVQKMQEAQAAVAAASSESIPQCAANENMTMLAAESEDTTSASDTDTGTGKGDK